MSELRGYELRIAVASASGWKVEVNDNPQRHVVYEPDGTIYSVDTDSPRLPRFESSIATAWPLLWRWMSRDRRWSYRVIADHTHTLVQILLDERLFAAGKTRSTGEVGLSKAISRAIVAAAESSHV